MRHSSMRGFTLVEVMIAVVIIGIFSSILVANMTGSGARGRDADRKSDLRILQAAIEAYKQRNGRYPVAGCVSPGSVASERTCSNYIVGLTPDYINVLPKDPKRSGTQNGYSYVTNTNGTVYKLMALSTVESETLAITSAMRSCDVGVTGSICLTTPSSNVCSPLNPRFQTSYGVWGGYADAATDALVRSGTQAVICQ